MAGFDIPALASSVINQAFDFASSIVETFTFKRTVPATYVPADGIDPAQTDDTQIGAIPLTFKSDEIDGKIVRVGDKKLLIKASELPIKPKADDFLVDANFRRWDVTGYMVPTTDKLWIVGIRAHEP